MKIIIKIAVIDILKHVYFEVLELNILQNVLTVFDIVQNLMVLHILIYVIQVYVYKVEKIVIIHI